MKNLENTRLLPYPVWQNPRVHLLDDIWLLTIVAIFTATVIPWYSGGLVVDFWPASLGLLALGGIHVVFTFLASPARLHGRWHGRSLTLLDVIGVLLIGFIWMHAGGLQNPMFLLAFTLPVISSIFLSRWHPYLIAAVSVLAVGTVALAQAPELRWYVSGLLGADAWLTSLFGHQSAAAQPSFSGFYAPTSYLIVLLEVFTVVLFACAVTAEYIGTIFERLNAHSIMSRNEAEHTQELWVSLIERLPLPAFLIDPETLQIVASTEFAVKYLRAEDTPLEGRKLFEVLRFSYPDVVQELITGSDGGAPVTVIRIQEQLRLTQVRVMHLAHKTRRLVLLSVEDATEVFCLKAALDSSEFASLVLDAGGRVLAFNKPIVGLFGSAEVGMDAAQLLSHTNAGPRWWEPGLTGRRKMHVEIRSRIYQVTSSAIALAGEEERIFAVSFLPVAKSEVDALETSSTVATSILRQLR